MDKIKENFPNEADKILGAKKKYIVLDLSKEKPSITSSKVGGVGYLPLSTPYPTNMDGRPLSFLAQINFSEMPELSPFPKSGILSFYVDYIDDLIGLDIDNRTSPNGFRVLYFNDLNEATYDEAKINSLFKPYENEEQFPVVQAETKLIGKLDECIPFSDIVEFTQLTGENFLDLVKNKIDDDELNELMYETFTESTIGGYPFFTQSDPREYNNELAEKFNTLLLQLNSNDALIWGDCGVGNFFINDEKLKNLDFSEVLYNWDCY